MSDMSDIYPYYKETNGEKGKGTNKTEADEDENGSRGRDDPGRECRVTEPTKEWGRHH